MPLYVFECPKHGRAERLCKVGMERACCGQCSHLMPRVYGYSMAITQPEADTRSMFRRFQEASSERPEVGPNLWQAAKQRAAAIERAGESPTATRRPW